MFIDFSRLKAFGCEIKIEDNEELEDNDQDENDEVEEDSYDDE